MDVKGDGGPTDPVVIGDEEGDQIEWISDVCSLSLPVPVPEPLSSSSPYLNLTLKTYRVPGSRSSILTSTLRHESPYCNE